MKTYPLTESQLGMFVAWNADRASTQFAVPVAFALTKDVDLDRLERAVRAVVDAHPVYRTRFVEEDGEVRQLSDPSVEIPIVRRRVSVAEAESALDAYPHPYDYFKGPLFRVEILETPENAWIVFDWAHVIVDGTSGTALFNEVSALYNEAKDAAAEGRNVGTEDVDIFTYAENEKKGFDSADYREAAEAAKARFGGRAMTVPEEQSKSEAEVEQRNCSYLEESAVVSRAGIDAWCRANGVHPNLFFMGVFARVLGLYANEKDVVFWTVNHGRKDPSLRATRGLLVKTVPVLGELKGDATLVDYFKSFKLHKAGVYPFTHFCRDLGIKPGWGFVFQEGTTNYGMTLGTGEFTGRLLAGGGADEMPVLQVFGGRESFLLQLTALPGRHSAAFLREFAARCATVAENVVLSGDKEGEASLLREVPVLSDGERDEVLGMSKGEELEYDCSKTFVDLFKAQAKARPEATAVVDCEGAISYGELDAQSDALAGELAELGLKPGSFAGLMLPRTRKFPIAMIAVQKCGAGYVPMDAEYPADRLAYMLENSEAPVLVTTKALIEGKGLEFRGKVVFLDGDRQQSKAAVSAAFNLATPETPAYMIYTSGSTGKPKGVVLPQRALGAMIAWFVRDCNLKPGKKNLSITSFSFDASVPDLFPPLAAGGELHILTEEQHKDLEGIHDYAVKVGATGLTTSTQLGLALVNTYPDLPLEYMMLGGEKMVPFAKTPVRMLNGYGPTEFAVCSSYHEVNQSKTYDIPIGRAVPNTWSFVVDKLGQLVPAGMTGELALAGPQIADGYWKLPEKTASVFVECGWLPAAAAGDGKRTTTRMYRTGDLARYDENGELEFQGRIDFQVKLRGFRIEFGEIEHAAASFPGVGAVAAEVKEVAGSKHLVLYFEGGVDVAALKAKMAETLTGYMVPDFFVAMDKLPLTPNGKIDRRKLPLPAADDEPIVPPETEPEKKVFAAVASVLKTEDFGVTHDFNRLGLTSLGAMSLLAKLKKSCGVAVTMKQLTANPTVRGLAVFVGIGEGRSGASARAQDRRRPRRQCYPMTENQRGIYADWLRNPGATQYNIPAAFRFAGMAPAKLAAAAEKVIAAHPAFMSRFVEKDGEIVQARRDDSRIAVPVEKVDAEPDAAFLGGAMKPFAPDAEVLCRATVYASPEAATLFLDVHHTVFDGYSVGIFLAELKRVLDGGEPAGESYTAFDAALDERDYLESETLDEDDKWFARYLEGAESTSVSTSTEGADGKPGELGRVCARIPSAAITARTRELGVTASDWLLTSFTELLKRVGREEDVLINFVTAGRSDPEVQETVGMFVKTLPLRGIRDAKTFPEAVKRMHGSVQDLIDRERQSYVRLAETLGVKPDIIFAFEGGIFDLPKGCELLAPELKFAKAPLSAIVTPGRDDFELVFEYDRSMYSEKDMSLLLGMFAQLAQNAVRAEDLREIPVLTDGERDKVQALSKGDAVEYDATKTVVNLIHANAIARPFATAVVDCEGSITYGELDAQSDALAGKLAELGVKPGGFVGLMLPRTRAFPIAMIAVQKCGAGYVPMDSEYPADRLAYMLENSEAPVLVTVRSLFADKKIEFKGKVVFVEREDFRRENEDGECLASKAYGPNLSTPSTPAYMIYTSGSTGRPKGVVIPHRALRHMVAWAVPAYGLKPGDKVATHPSFSFDASVIDLFPTLCAGGELHIYGEELRKDLPGMRDYIMKNGIVGGTMSTQIGMTLLDTYPDLPLRYLVVGGEKLLPISKTGVRIFNGYGPTEFTVCSSYQVVDQSKEGDIPIGRAVPGTYSLVVDRYGQLLPQGYAGELALAGPQIAEGYWKLPEKTASVFVEAAWQLRGGGEDNKRTTTRMYRTGDLARYNDEGTLDYMGRLDFQVKLRGFRIEIGEIEHRASTFDGVKGVAAEVRDVAGAKHLVLYYGSDKAVDEAALKTHMAAALTDYMVPDYFVRMDPMPMTPNGKINRKLLPSPEGASAVEEYVEPANETERKIAAVYAEILKLEKYGATTDFFASGGTSLVCIKAVVALQKQGLDVQYGDLFKYKTPRALAAFLDPSLKVEGCETGDAGPVGKFDYGAYDYAAIDKLLMATPTELFGGFRRHSLGDVLLCGATGYLGIHVFRYLLESTDATVYALIRPKKGVGAAKRLDSQYVYYFGERMPKRFNERLAFIEGDITDPNLAEKLKDLKIGTVFNCAALVKHYVADDLMDRINVGGVENLIAWCGQSGARLVHISTYSVGGMVRTASPAVLDERHLYVGQESDNDYVRTKFLAERALLAAVAAGKLRGKIMRLGNLMGREADGEFQMNVGSNAFVNSLKSYRALGVYPLENLVGKIEMSPIDRVAEAVCLLAMTPDEMCVFHPYNCYPLDMGAVMGAMNRRGFDVDWVSREDFAAHVDAMRNDPSRASELQGILHYTGHLLKGLRITPAPNDWTTTVLYRLGFRWKPADDTYLANFLEMLDGLAVFG